MLYGGKLAFDSRPSTRPATPATDGASTRFAALHRRAVVLNGIALVIGIGLLVAFANRPAPRTAGIVEPTPQGVRQRARLRANTPAPPQTSPAPAR